MSKIKETENTETGTDKSVGVERVVIKRCNCWLGILNNYDQTELNNLYLDNYIQRLNEKSKHSMTMSNLSKNWIKIMPKEYVDKRKGFATLFNYCPICGNKINWAKIRNAL